MLMHTKGREGRFCKIIILGTQTMLILMERTTFFLKKKLQMGRTFKNSSKSVILTNEVRNYIKVAALDLTNGLSTPVSYCPLGN